ncbi:MAG TPA: cytochrome c [Pseudomonadales bacterium]|jgi:cytochrome c oxidase cbb3-type subunit 3|nr:cytochrome c [Pseudomonadales bacterium]HNL91386.1 cytochrome c [Pseudomonadales bacterium]HNN85882.1 cytochrome c [Pseudomonadales bacterium]
MKNSMTGLLSAMVLAVAGVSSSTAWSESAYPKAEKNYDTYCAQCHGVLRNGKGINAKHMSVQPRDHADGKAMGDLPDTEIFKAIKEGGPAVNKSVLMPVWGGVLSDAEIQEMVLYLREVCKCGKK